MKEKREIIMKRLLLLLSFFFLVPIIQAQDSVCTPAIQFHYDENAKIFSLVNANGDILQSYSEIRDYDEQAHSPDCRFVVATLWRDYNGNERPDLSIAGDTTVWNATTGEQLQVFEDAHESPHSILWSPDSERIIVGTRYGYFLWNFYTDSTTQLSQHGIGEWRLHTIWDSNRTELLVLPYYYYFSEDDVSVYNWLSGEHIADYSAFLAPEPYTYTKTTFALRGNWLIVAADSFRQNTPITIWDRTSHQPIYQVNAGTFGIIPQYDPVWIGAVDLSAQAGSRLVDVSPEGRYLVVGFRTLRVWDLANLPEAFEDRTATYQYPIDNRGMNAVHFIDNTTVEILLDDNITLIRMNILTGEIVQ
jgi:hypothetical protein